MGGGGTAPTGIVTGIENSVHGDFGRNSHIPPLFTLVAKITSMGVFIEQELILHGAVADVYRKWRKGHQQRDAPAMGRHSGGNGRQPLAPEILVFSGHTALSGVTDFHTDVSPWVFQLERVRRSGTRDTPVRDPSSIHGAGMNMHAGPGAEPADFT